MSDNKEVKEKKKKGPIRFEAIVPVAILSLITFIYFSFYFDIHLKKIIEYVGTQANGAEVNIDSVDMSFIGGSFDLNRLQVTDKDRPSLNSIEIENVHFQFLWDALLRMKFVVEDASISNIQLSKPRSSPGKVLPPEPAKPSKLDEMQNEVIGQVKDKYGKNVLGDIVSILEGGDFENQLDQIKGDLKSEARINALTKNVKEKKEFWDKKIETLSDTSKLKAIESEINSLSKKRNFLEKAQGVKKLTDLLKDVQKQSKELQSASKKLQAEIKETSSYTKEIDRLVKEDIASLQNRFSIPKIDFKDMAMHLFAGEFAEKISKARKYQALAKQYLPRKKEKEAVIPRKRSEGKNYDFPITKGYPLFWLKHAAISSEGTAESYSGKVSGDLTNVTTSPKVINKPIKLDVRGDFPDAKVMGAKAIITADFTKDIGKQTALIQVNSFAVPEKFFVNDEQMKFGFLDAVGTTTISATMVEDNISMTWNSVLNNPNFVVDSKSKLAEEMLTKILNDIPMITINGAAKGSFNNLNMDISSNLGDELGNGLKREIGNKLNEAQEKLSALVNQRIDKPKDQLMSQIGGNKENLDQLGDVNKLYKKNESKIKTEIAKLQKGGTDDLKEKGKKLLKGFKF